ncbi:MAG: DUF4198 domain-containing protein [Thermomonas sp.]|uniref:DUF4198 domain-containing protein n=1 Tax=Thermomonas sp. TaxID=1971895 RepID=UPI001EB7793D|nr:DUF4198 domain-containing protein [Thermomonas sp.]MBV2209079.1 DUF4198 domain-containing protein [Thermomonas sp.]
MKRTTLALAAALCLLPLTSMAHKQWMVPSATVVAGNNAWVTVDAAISNQLYYPDHFAMQLDNVTITAPDGSTFRPENPASGKYRSVFDVPLKQDGTYRIANVNAALSARWDTPESIAAAKAAKDGKAPPGGFLRGVKAEELATKIPNNALNVQVTEGNGRVETFVTHGAPSTVAPVGKGLELAPITHPNDLFAGEEASFKLLVDGKPAAGLEVEIIRGGTRYRNAQDEIKVTTAADGSFKVTWPEAGMYWLEASTTDKNTSVPQAKQRRLSYVATLEVLPQ